MTWKVAIVGLILLAAILPLAAMPPAVVLLVTLVFVVCVVLFVSANAQPVARFALTLLRAPPSR